MGTGNPSLCAVGMIMDVLFFLNWKQASNGKIITDDITATMWKTTVVIH